MTKHPVDVAFMGIGENGASNIYPSSILREHPNCTIYLDEESSSLFTVKTI